MIRKIIVIQIIIFNCLVSSGQYIDNKLDIGFGTGFDAPLNLNTIRRTNSFRYPSLFGNYALGVGLRTNFSYHYTESIRFGAKLGYTRFGNWNGDQEVFIITQPALSLKSFSASILYIPKSNQFKSPYLKWGYSLSPVLTYQSLEWEGLEQSVNNVWPLSFSKHHAGLMMGISVFSELSNTNGLRLDINYQFSIVNSPYYLDRTFHSLDISFLYYFKLLKNRYFMYD